MELYVFDTFYFAESAVIVATVFCRRLLSLTLRLISRGFKKTTTKGQRERKVNKGLMSRTMAVHVR